ncbi:MAG: NADH-quinone oxidoreductase subunit L [Candidatus Acidifodinimicrobium sp.]
MILYLILLPMLISMALTAFLKDKLVRSRLIAVSMTSLSLLISSVFFYVYFSKDLIESFSWFSIGTYTFQISFIANNLHLLMAIVVSFISLMILIFSIFYMRREKQEKYYFEMSLFIFAMLGLVISNSFLLFYIFWELMSISSYLLIGFWYEKEAASKAAKKALILTKIGDISLLAAIIVLFANTGTLSISATLSGLSSIPQVYLTISAALFIIAALSKSAQFPFYVWLPDAMEAPTTVSALLHSATMVASGAFLLIVIAPLMYASGTMAYLVLISLITVFISSLLALDSVDTKRILAYSTIDSLAFMFLAVATLNPDGALFYLIMHAIFKSLLFLLAGELIILFGTRNIFKLRGLGIGKPIFYVPAFIGLASLAGIPPFLGFFAHATLSYNFSLSIELIFMAATFLTSLFSFRLFFTVYHENGTEKIREDKSAIIPIAILSILSTVGGASLFFFNSIIPIAYSFDLFLVLDSIIALLGLFAAYYLYSNRNFSYAKLDRKLKSVFRGVTYDEVLASTGTAITKFGGLVDRFEYTLGEAFNRVSSLSFSLSYISRELQSGDLSNYIVVFIAGVILVMILMMVGV